MEPGEKGRRKTRRSVLAAAAAFSFLASFDTSAVSIALPRIASSFGVSGESAAWIAGVFLITLSVLTLPLGRLGDILGQKKVFRLGLLIFSVGSFLCSLAESLPALALARVVQAAGEAAGLANSQGIVTREFPPEESGEALGRLGTFSAVGSLAGPALGGMLLTFANWKWVFWADLIPGAAVYFICFRTLHGKVPVRGGKLDFPGTAGFALWAGPLLFALEYGPAAGFKSPVVLSCFGVSCIAGILFVTREKKAAQPLLNLAVFRNRKLSLSVFCAFTSFASLACSSLVLPFYLQNGFAMSPGEAGAYLSVNPLVLAVSASAGGRISDRFGPEPVTLVGLLLTGTGLFLMSGFREASPLWLLVLFLSVMALGNGLFQPPNNALVMSLVTPEKYGLGGSVNALSRNFGMAAGTALATLFFRSGAGPAGSGLYSGVRTVYLSAGAVCLAGAAAALIRFLWHRKT